MPDILRRSAAVVVSSAPARSASSADCAAFIGMQARYQNARSTATTASTGPAVERIEAVRHGYLKTRDEEGRRVMVNGAPVHHGSINTRIRRICGRKIQ